MWTIKVRSLDSHSESILQSILSAISQHLPLFTISRWINIFVFDNMMIIHWNVLVFGLLTLDTLKHSPLHMSFLVISNASHFTTTSHFNDRIFETWIYPLHVHWFYKFGKFVDALHLMQKFGFNRSCQFTVIAADSDRCVELISRGREVASCHLVIMMMHFRDALRLDVLLEQRHKH